MLVTIELAEKRLEIARKLEKELHGKHQHGLTVWKVDDVTIIDDSQDRWAAWSSEYDDAVERY